MIKKEINNSAYPDVDSPLYEIDDDTPLYSIDDDRDVGEPDNEEDEEPDQDECISGRINDEADEEEVDEKTVKKSSPLAILVKTMLTPVEGWKALKRAGFRSEEFASRCFYPLVAFAAVSDVMKVFYEANRTVAEWAVDGLITFITFFFGYFTVLLSGNVLLPKKSREFLKKEVGKQFVMLNLSTLAIFWSLIQLVPMLDPVLVFLPIWTIYLIYKGVRMIRVPSDVENSTTGILCTLIIGVLVLWHWLLTEILIPATATV